MPKKKHVETPSQFFHPWRVLADKVVELERNYGIEPNEIWFRLLDHRGSAHNLPIVAHQIGDIPLMNDRLRFYQRALKLQEKQLSSYRRSRKILEVLNKRQHHSGIAGLIEGVENLKEAALLEEALILTELIHKVSRRLKTLHDLAEEMKLGRKKRRSNPQQSELIRDTITSLYEYLTMKLPGDRARGHPSNPKRILSTSPRPYKQRALVWTADLVTLAYQPSIPGFKITPDNVRSCLQHRRRRSSTAR